MNGGLYPGSLGRSLSAGCNTVSRGFPPKCMEGILWIQRILIGEDLERSALDLLHPTCDLFRMLENRSSARPQEPKASI
jgi:hypothetical protein